VLPLEWDLPCRGATGVSIAVRPPERVLPTGGGGFGVSGTLFSGFMSDLTWVASTEFVGGWSFCGCSMLADCARVGAPVKSAADNSMDRKQQITLTPCAPHFERLPRLSPQRGLFIVLFFGCSEAALLLHDCSTKEQALAEGARLDDGGIDEIEGREKPR
jgi:hypothetical protein